MITTNYDTKYYMDTIDVDVNFPNNDLFTPAFNKFMTDTINSFVNKINVVGLDVLIKLGAANIFVVDCTQEKLDITICITVGDKVYKTILA